MTDKIVLGFEAFRANGSRVVSRIETSLYNPYTEGVTYGVSVPAIKVSGEDDLWVQDVGGFRVRVVI